MHALASTYDALGRHAEALKLFEETLALRKAKYGLDDPATRREMFNLAVAYTRPQTSEGPGSRLKKCA
jgi:hypothetical protein